MKHLVVRKKPLSVEAFQFNGQPPEEWPKWVLKNTSSFLSPEGSIRSPVIDGRGHLRDSLTVYVTSKNGVHRNAYTVPIGYFIVKEPNGRIRPYSPDAFYQTHEILPEILTLSSSERSTELVFLDVDKVPADAKTPRHEEDIAVLSAHIQGML